MQEYHYKEQDIHEVEKFMAELASIPEENRAYVDQAGIGDDERPARGYSKKGELCIGKKPAFAKKNSI